MLRLLKQIRRNEQGSNVVEMALVLFLLLFLLAGVVDIGRAFNNYIIIINASREGARYAARSPNDETGIQNSAILEASGSGVALEPDDVTVTGLGAATGNPITVTVTYQFSTIMGNVLGMDDLSLRGVTEMVAFGFD